MSVTNTPHINFSGDARRALETTFETRGRPGSASEREAFGILPGQRGGG
jgi:hypothetical protein